MRLMPSLHNSMNFLHYRRHSLRNAAVVCGFNQFQSLVLAKRAATEASAELDYPDYLLAFCSAPRHFMSSFQFSSTPVSLSAIKTKTVCLFLDELVVPECAFELFELRVKLQRGQPRFKQ